MSISTISAIIKNELLKHKTKLLLWPFQSWSEPCRKWVRWTEEKKHCHEAVNLKDLEWFWMKECSLISCQVFFNLIRFYRRTFRKVKLANIGFKKYWIKVNCGQCVLEKNIYFIMIFPPILNSYYPMKGNIFVIKKTQIKRINNTDSFSQPCLIIFTKGDDIFGHDCIMIIVWFGYHTLLMIIIIHV